jgi:Protein of unknown function (DUF3563).
MLKKFKSRLAEAWKRFCMSEEERYLMQATDLEDLERRMQRWREMEIERKHRMHVFYLQR